MDLGKIGGRALEEVNQGKIVNKMNERSFYFLIIKKIPYFHFNFTMNLK